MPDIARAEEPRVPVDRAFAEQKRRPAQRVGAAGEDEVGFAFADVLIRGVDRLHAGAAIDLHSECGHGLAHAEAQRGDARGIHLVGDDVDAAEDDLVEGVGGKRLAQQQRPSAFDGEIDRRERPRPPARADERRAAAVDDVDRARCYSAAVARNSGCDDVSPLEVTRGLDPRVHPLRNDFFAQRMDCRVKPGNDDCDFCIRITGRPSARARRRRRRGRCA
jgi:hypothetical protein